MEKIPHPNAENRVQAISAIIMQQMVLNKTLQADDVKELYEQLARLDSQTLITQAARDAHLTEGLAPEHTSALHLRMSQEVFGTDPFTDENSPRHD